MSAFFSWINNMSAFVLVRPSKVVPWKTGIGLCLSLKPQRWWAPLVCTVFCVYSISDPEAENEEWRCHPKAISYSSFSCSWHGVPHASITVSLSLSHSHTFWMCRGNAAAGFYVPSWLHHSSHHLSRAHPLWTAISFSGNPAEDEPMEKKRQEGRSCLCSASHAYTPLFCAIFWNPMRKTITHIYLYISMFLSICDVQLRRLVATKPLAYSEKKAAV